MQLLQIHKCYCSKFAKTDQNEFLYQASKGLTRHDCISRLKSNLEVYDNHSNLHNCHAMGDFCILQVIVLLSLK